MSREQNDQMFMGYTLNQQRLEAQQEKLAELKQTIALSARLIHNKNLSTAESRGILAILEKYSHALTVLDDYDHLNLLPEGEEAIALSPAVGKLDIRHSKASTDGGIEHLSFNVLVCSHEKSTCQCRCG